MATEDFTGYEEVDPNSDITKTSSRVTADTMRHDAVAYVYKDKGVDHFTDFEHLFDIQGTAFDVKTGAGCGMYTWHLANALDAGEDGTPLHIAVAFYYSDGGPLYIKLRERYDASNYDDNYAVSLNTTYYLTVEKSGTALTCKIYSDEARTNLLDTLSLTLHADHNFRYVYAVASYHSGWQPTNEASGYIENLDLQEAAAEQQLFTLINMMGY